MTQAPAYFSHRDIISLWEATVKKGSSAAGRSVVQTSIFTALALDITRAMGGIRCTYFKVYRWWERNTIPPQYYPAIVAAAKTRGFSGVTDEVLAGIKSREYLSRHAGACG